MNQRFDTRSQEAMKLDTEIQKTEWLARDATGGAKCKALIKLKELRVKRGKL